MFLTLFESLSRGHWRVACRRYLMLRTTDALIPGQLDALCERLLVQCSLTERVRISNDVAVWARMVGASPPALHGDHQARRGNADYKMPRSPPNTRRNVQTACAADPIASSRHTPDSVKTIWRPWPACFALARQSRSATSS